MSTPTWVRFSPVPDTPEQLLDAARPLLDRLEFELVKVSRLGWDPYEEAFGYAGDQDANSTVKCATEADALAAARGWQGFSLHYNALSAWTDVFLYFWNGEQGTNLVVELGSSALYYKGEGFREGQWVRDFLIGYTAAVGADVCGYGTPYKVVYQPLDPARVLAELASGTLVRYPSPVMHLISFRLVGPGQVAPLLAAQNPEPSLAYAQTTSGYHVLADLP